MHCLIFCAGTDGDCFPLFTLARRLISRGHRVTVTAPPIYSGIPVLQGIGFQPLSTFGEHERFLADAIKLADRYGLVLCRRHAVPWNLTAWRTIESLKARDLLVLAPNQPSFWADVAANLAWGCATVRFQIDPPRITTGPSSQVQPGNAQQYLAASLAMEWHGAATKERIPATGRSLASLSRAQPNIPTIALYPDWLVGGRGAERNVRYFGFLLPEPNYQYLPESDIPPMKGHAIFKRGLTDFWPERFCSVAADTCRNLGMPCLFLGGTPLYGDPNAETISRRFVPLRRALENALVILHNGGIGTAALAIKCGVPQIIVPRIFKQPSIAEWLRRLGVAAVIAPDRLAPNTLRRQIEQLTNRKRPRMRSLELSSRIDSPADSRKICEFLESLSESELRHSAG